MARLPTSSPTKSASSTNKRKAPSQLNGNSPKKKKPQCPICRKFHHGDCIFAKTNTKSKDTSFKGKNNQFHLEFFKLMINKSDGDSSGYSTYTSWKKHTTQEERVFLIGTTADASDSNTPWIPLKSRNSSRRSSQRRKGNSFSPTSPIDYMLPLKGSSLISVWKPLTAQDRWPCSMSYWWTLDAPPALCSNNMPTTSLKYTTYGGTTTSSY